MKIMSTENKVAKTEATYETQLAKVNNLYLPMITSQLENNNIQLSEYAKSCVVNAISAINGVLDTNGTSWNDKQLDTNGMTQILLNIAALQLNAAANPRECYFQIRSFQTKDADGKAVWKKKVEMGIEGDGFDALVANFGRDVKKVFPHWLVREDDEFKYPRYVGLELTPPEWQPKGNGKVVRVVYPIQATEKTVTYYISERADVKKNLIAHISNNMMNETFGFVTGQKKDSYGKMVDRTRYDATPEEKANIDAKKKEILAKAKELELDAILDSADFDKYISPAWKEEQSRESMIIRKMRNNVVKKIPKDFSSSFVSEIYNENTDESYKAYNEEYVTVEEEELEPIALGDGTMVDKETGEIKGQPEF
jgi:hypothetical protein